MICGRPWDIGMKAFFLLVIFRGLMACEGQTAVLIDDGILVATPHAMKEC